ncbi:hypothetical protein ACFOTA_21280 [Chitinophaga sp. GCM10012297]|uniref:HD domain-containing protein n=1 Tax=Chitinophaga chungangae TaxID=2821488 RepID=A0ABS3YJ98_9BACT|nr:hypothetical protein [Chitinophaga chungangae]MBO9154760.1 hypothetical protein [Chitinophaga chungangae]
MQFPDPNVETLLQRFQPALGGDYEKYRNHVYRVLANCLLLDDNANVPTYAIAAVFHDIGIWTDHTFDYLAPSIAQLRAYFTETGQEALLEEISLMISWHHKTSRYTGPFEKTVETFREADWTDVSLGLTSFGIQRSQLKAIREKFPNRGFHWFLLRQTFRNFLKHPLNPLPVFKK